MTKIEDAISYIVTVLSQEEEVTYNVFTEIIECLTDDEENCEELLSGNVQMAIDIVWNTVGKSYMIDADVHYLAYALLDDLWQDVTCILLENGIDVTDL